MLALFPQVFFLGKSLTLIGGEFEFYRLGWGGENISIFSSWDESSVHFPLEVKLQGVFLSGAIFKPIFLVGRGSHWICDTGMLKKSRIRFRNSSLVPGKILYNVLLVI